MKPIIAFLFFILLHIPVSLFAQTSPAKWRWGVGAGVNTLWIPKGGMDINIGIAEDNKTATITRVGNRVGYQVMGNVRYRFNRRWSLVSGLGVTKANSKAYRETEHEGHIFGFPNDYIAFDTIALKHLLLDAKVNVRFQITNNIPLFSDAHLFLDVGVIGELPLINNATYSYSQNYNDYSYSHGKLNVVPLAPLIAISIAGQHVDFSLGFSLLNYNSAQDDHSYNAVLTRMMLSWYFSNVR